MLTYHRNKIWRILPVLIIICLYLLINVGIKTSLNSYFSIAITKCANTKAESDALNYIIIKTHKILTNHGMDPFLCYGSLWGALRFRKPLPWDYDFDIGVLYDEFHKADFSLLEADFYNEGMEIFYQYYSGNYKVRYSGKTGDIMLYVKRGDMAERVGIESWLLYLHYKLYHRFPYRLIEKPLPKLKFLSIDYSVPREGIEMQKYLYKTNWWKEEIPRGCNVTKNYKK